MKLPAAKLRGILLIKKEKAVTLNLLLPFVDGSHLFRRTLFEDHKNGSFNLSENTFFAFK